MELVPENIPPKDSPIAFFLIKNPNNLYEKIKIKIWGYRVFILFYFTNKIVVSVKAVKLFMVIYWSSIDGDLA